MPKIKLNVSAVHAVAGQGAGAGRGTHSGGGRGGAWAAAAVHCDTVGFFGSFLIVLHPCSCLVGPGPSGGANCEADGATVKSTRTNLAASVCLAAAQDMDLTPQEGEAALGLQLPAVHHGEGFKVHANVRCLPALQAQGKAAAQNVADGCGSKSGVRAAAIHCKAVLKPVASLYSHRARQRHRMWA